MLPAHTLSCTKAPRRVPRLGQEPAVLTSQAGTTTSASLRSLFIPRRPPVATLLTWLHSHCTLSWCCQDNLLGVPTEEGAANRGEALKAGQSRATQTRREGRKACHSPWRNHRIRLMAQCPQRAGPQVPTGEVAAPCLGGAGGLGSISKGPEHQSRLSPQPSVPGKQGKDTCVYPRPIARTEEHSFPVPPAAASTPGPHGPASHKGPNPRRHPQSKANNQNSQCHTLSSGWGWLRARRRKDSNPVVGLLKNKTALRTNQLLQGPAMACTNRRQTAPGPPPAPSSPQ